MVVRSLEKVAFKSIIDCFLISFKNYFVEMPTDVEYYKERWDNAKVRLELSYGMFDDEKLVGFIINGIDKRNGDIIAFNTGTGVIPEYRGKKIVKSIYEYALKDLKQNGITKCALEVIKENVIAIKSYESIGFKKSKDYKCFKGKLDNVEDKTVIELNEIDYTLFDTMNLPNQEYYSWDNHKKSVRGVNYRYFQVLKDEVPESYFVINPINGYLAQFDLLSNNELGWNHLFLGIKNICKSIKINNVDARLVDKISYLNSIGVENIIDQYEMELTI
ncbi:ribosomal protein S18 acetylase RimI-like enzyme [Aquimarina sp. MAR_2010_214]|uniref:GNAT family N-acetyltransferase n=1 Tax=Aquimarina sp. MAR_2010_214 TaxID=1250026 RepID=UPI000C706538|nr:GNAT family N-acetyltransferase [Aquimarina sp. MAR_2010_214]PKV48936.1 ribosomal protein S18 acetylase RimI-like enzyme [Aquimarina sp. MAR_2010_214]